MAALSPQPSLAKHTAGIPSVLLCDEAELGAGALKSQVQGADALILNVLSLGQVAVASGLGM